VDRRTLTELVVVGILLFIILIIFIGALAAPNIFWDDFVWKYYWGPIVADAGGDAGGLTAEYNWFDTLTYGLILAVSAYFIHKLFVKLDIRTGTLFFISMVPALIIGPAARVLEDMELFNEPLQYLFISPIIYIFMGLTALGTVICGYYLEKLGRRGSRASGVFLFMPGLIVSLVISAFPSWISGAPSIVPILLITVASVGVYSYLKDSRMEIIVLFFWLQILLFTAYMYLLWILKGDWYDVYVIGHDGIEPELWGGAGIIVLVLVSTLLVAGSLKLVGKKWDKFGRLVTWINVMIIGSHMTDASATFIGIDIYDYYEKHVVPSGLMNAVESTGFPYPGMIMYPLKLVFLIPALYIMDISMEKESKENPHMLSLVKLAIIVLGFGPGVRDLIRIALGV
jgi:uncharacterized membrane protein